MSRRFNFPLLVPGDPLPARGHFAAVIPNVSENIAPVEPISAEVTARLMVHYPKLAKGGGEHLPRPEKRAHIRRLQNIDLLVWIP
jgi:hypothetical protein